MMEKEIKGLYSLEDALFHLQVNKPFVQKTLNDYWTLH